MQLACVPPERVQEFWPHARPYVYAAMDRVGMDRTGDDVEKEVFAGRALLWLAIADAKVIGAAVTQIVHDICWIEAVGADDLRQCLPALATFEEYARDRKCTAIRLCGRHGWSRVLTDFRQKAVVLEKVLTHG